MSFSGLLSGARPRRASKDRHGSFLETASMSFDHLKRQSISGSFHEKYWTSTSSVLDMASSYSRAVMDNLSRHELDMSAVGVHEDYGDDYDDDATSESFTSDSASGDSVLTGYLIGGDGAEREQDGDGNQSENDDADMEERFLEQSEDEDDDWEDCSDTVTENSDDDLENDDSADVVVGTLKSQAPGKSSPVVKSPKLSPGGAGSRSLKVSKSTASPSKLVVSDVRLRRRPESDKELSPRLAHDEKATEGRRSATSMEAVERAVDKSPAGDGSVSPASSPPPSPIDPTDLPRSLGESSAIAEEQQAQPRRWTEGADVFGRNRPQSQSHRSRVGAVARAGLFRRDDVLRKSETVRRHMAVSKPSSTPPLLPTSSQPPTQEQAVVTPNRLTPEDSVPSVTLGQSPGGSLRIRANALLPEWGKSVMSKRRQRKDTGSDNSARNSQAGDDDSAGSGSPAPSVTPRNNLLRSSDRSASLKRQSYLDATEPRAITPKTPKKPFKLLKSLISSKSSTPGSPGQRSSSKKTLNKSSSSEANEMKDEQTLVASYNRSTSVPAALDASTGKKWVSANKFLTIPALPKQRNIQTSDEESADERASRSTDTLQEATKHTATSDQHPPSSSVLTGNAMVSHNQLEKRAATGVAPGRQHSHDEAEPPVMRAERKVPRAPKSSRTQLPVGKKLPRASPEGDTAGAEVPQASGSTSQDASAAAETSPTEAKRRRQLPSTPNTKPFIPKAGLELIGVVKRRTPKHQQRNRIVSTIVPTPVKTDPRAWGAGLTSMADRRYSLPLPPRTGDSPPLSDMAFVATGKLRRSSSPVRKRLARRRGNLNANRERSSTMPGRVSIDRGVSPIPGPITIPTRVAEDNIGDECLLSPIGPSPEDFCHIPGPAPVQPVYRNILDLEVRYIAEELTLMDAELLRNIEPQELADCAWMAKDRETRAPNIMRMVDAFNRIALLTTTKVLTPSTPSERASVIGFFVKVAEECLKLHNFNSLKAVLAGLQCTPMFRLKKTWREVSNNKHRRFAELSELMTEMNNYALYRELMDEAMKSPPCVPFLGVFLTQVVQVDSFNKLQRKVRNKSLRRSMRRASSRMSRRASRRPTARVKNRASTRGSRHNLASGRSSGHSTPAHTLTPSSSTHDLRIKGTRPTASPRPRKKSLPSKLSIDNTPRQRKPIVFGPTASENSPADEDWTIVTGEECQIGDSQTTSHLKELYKQARDGAGAEAAYAVRSLHASTEDPNWYKDDESDDAPGNDDEAKTPLSAVPSSASSHQTRPSLEQTDENSSRSKASSSVSATECPTPIPQTSASSLASHQHNVLNSVTPVPIITRLESSGNIQVIADDDEDWEDVSDVLPSPDPLTPGSMPSPPFGFKPKVTPARDIPSPRLRTPSPLARSPSPDSRHLGQPEGGRMKERTESGDHSETVSLQSPCAEDSAYCTGSEKTRHSRNSSMDSPFVQRATAAMASYANASPSMSTGRTAENSSATLSTDGPSLAFQERAIDVTPSLLDLSILPPKPPQFIRDRRNASRVTSNTSVGSGLLSPTGTRVLWSRDTSEEESGGLRALFDRRASRDSVVSNDSSTGSHSLLPNGKKKSHSRQGSLTLFSKQESTPASLPSSPTTNFKREVKHMSLSRQRSNYLSVALATATPDGGPDMRLSTASLDEKAISAVAAQHASVPSSPSKRSLLRRRKTDSTLVVPNLNTEKEAAPVSGYATTPKKLSANAVTASEILARGNSPGIRERLKAAFTPRSRGKAPGKRQQRKAAQSQAAAKARDLVDARPPVSSPAATGFSSLEMELERYKAAAAEYHHCSRPWVRYCIVNTEFNTEEENYRLSCEREPKGDEKSTKLLKILPTRRGAAAAK